VPIALGVRRPFGVLWLATLLFYLGFQLLLPVMPLYATQLGASEAQVGLVMGGFAFAAMLLRPLAGELADRIGRRPLVLLGTGIFALASAGYAAIATVPGLILWRMFHGTGMGLGPTAGTVIVADLTPPERRGAAMGVYGLASAVALSLGPFAGGELVRAVGFTRTFLISTAIGVAALALASVLPETRPVTRAARRVPEGVAVPASALARFGRRWFSRAAVYPSGLAMSLYLSYGGLATLLPLFAERRHLGNPGLFYTMFALVTLAVRSPAGRWSDRMGRRAVIAPALAFAGLGLVALGLAASRAMFLGAAALYGVGFGAAQPALLAMTADRVAPDERGRAMGTLYAAWELAILGGAILLGLCAPRLGYTLTWWIAAMIAGVGALAALVPGIRARR
jgi:MFS family permease